MKSQLILASTSVYRQELLKKLGVPFTAQKPVCDEDQYKSQIADPLALASLLASEKAKSLLKPGCVLIGGDQVVALEEQILGKSKTREKAIQQLQFMQGKAHQLVTAICVLSEEKVLNYIDITHLKMKPLNTAQIAAYVDSEKPFDCAGSYKIESLGISLFESIETQDFTAIQGLPLLKLSQMLNQFGFQIPGEKPWSI
jgi:septum formation protein